jgi:hypothetical protein
MIERVEGAPAGVLAFRAIGKVEASDYEVLKPAIEAGIKERGKVRIVFEMGPEFDGYSAGAAWEDAKLWAPHLMSWERCAVVTDHDFMAGALKVVGAIMPGEIKVFPVGELDEALAWAAE